MAYVKSGWEKSDVYLFGGVTNAPPNDTHVIVCSGCLFYRSDDGDPFSGRDVNFHSPYSVLAHLEEHRAAGHVVPESAIEKIRNDDWI